MYFAQIDSKVHGSTAVLDIGTVIVIPHTMPRNTRTDIVESGAVATGNGCMEVFVDHNLPVIVKDGSVNLILPFPKDVVERTSVLRGTATMIKRRCIR